MNWGNPEILYSLLLIPLLVIVLVFYTIWQKKRFSKFAETRFFDFFLGEFSIFHWVLKNILVILALTLLIIASARPQWGKEAQIVRKEGLDIAICIDVSKSMEATDIRPNRLRRAKDQISLFIDQLGGDRVALIPFAGSSFVHLPLTDDYASAKMFLNLLDTDMVPVGGTNVGHALETARSAFPDIERNRVIIVISDGEDLEQEGVTIAGKIAEEGIVIHALGVGSHEGSPIPLRMPNGSIEYGKDSDGNIIITKMDADVLTEIARAGNGRFYAVTPHQAEIFEIMRAIETLERDRYDAQEFVRYREQFRYFAIIALLLLLIESVITHRRKLIRERNI